MKKLNFIIYILIFVLISFIYGCSSDNIDLSKVSEEDVNKVIVCPDDYIRFGSSCCLDIDKNKICDKDESIEETNTEENSNPSEEEISCSDECSSNICSGKEYILCLEQSDGCKDEVNKGKLIGKCSVECLKDSDCNSDKKCEDNKCVEEECEDECSSNSCSGKEYIVCSEQSDGCKDEINNGKVIDKCSVECLTNSDCSSNQKCENNLCAENEVTSSIPTIVMLGENGDGTAMQIATNVYPERQFIANSLIKGNVITFPDFIITIDEIKEDGFWYLLKETTGAKRDSKFWAGVGSARMPIVLGGIQMYFEAQSNNVLSIYFERS